MEMKVMDEKKTLLKTDEIEREKEKRRKMSNRGCAIALALIMMALTLAITVPATIKHYKPTETQWYPEWSKNVATTVVTSVAAYTTLVVGSCILLFLREWHPSKSVRRGTKTIVPKVMTLVVVISIVVGVAAVIGTHWFPGWFDKELQKNDFLKAHWDSMSIDEQEAFGASQRCCKWQGYEGSLDRCGYCYMCGDRECHSSLPVEVCFMRGCKNTFSALFVVRTTIFNPLSWSSVIFGPWDQFGGEFLSVSSYFIPFINAILALLIAFLPGCTSSSPSSSGIKQPTI